VAGAGARVGLIARLAGRADIPVFPVVGVGGRAGARSLGLLDGVRVVDHPREATLLVVTGRPTRALLPPLLSLHDQLPTPRATVWWRGVPGGEELMAAVGPVVVCPSGDGGALRAVFADLVSGVRHSDPAALPDIETAWRGVGPYGQGGTGMTGGNPYGRPLPARAPDPDGLELDQLQLRVGPAFPPLPPGLVLDLGVQGDVIRTVAVGANPFTRWLGDQPLGPIDSQRFLDAAGAPTPVATIELARARHHLRWAAGALRLHGLGARGRAVAGLAEALDGGSGPATGALADRLLGSRSLRSTMEGLAVLSGEDARAAGGPVARAAGIAVDVRTDDAGYAGLGFEPVVHDEGDAWARFGQRLLEAAQAVELARRSGDRVRQPGPTLEGPRGQLAPGGTVTSAWLAGVLPTVLAGAEWGDAMTAVVSLDLDLEEVAAADETAGAIR